jgi:hypothetical protein
MNLAPSPLPEITLPSKHVIFKNGTSYGIIEIAEMMGGVASEGSISVLSAKLRLSSTVCWWTCRPLAQSFFLEFQLPADTWA